MINLLPSDTRENIMYARRNTKLMRWATALLVGISGIIIVVVAGYFYIDQGTKSMERQSAQTQAELKTLKIDETKKHVEDLGITLKLVTQVLSKQVLMSKLLQQTGAVMPNGAALAGLTVNKLEGGLDLTVSSRDYQTATQVQVNLQDPDNKIFDKVDIINISCAGAGAGAPADYPCSGRYRALFAKENSFMLLSPAKTGAVAP